MENNYTIKQSVKNQLLLINYGDSSDGLYPAFYVFAEFQT